LSGISFKSLRPYKTYLITPLIFCAVSWIFLLLPSKSEIGCQVALFLLCMPIIAAPVEALAALGTNLTGPGDDVG
jgi:hypothetical protein